MRLSKSAREGWLMIDERASGGALREMATVTCSHCQRQVIRNPARTRERAWCSRCDKYICDDCAVTGDCKPFFQRLDLIDAKTHKRTL